MKRFMIALAGLLFVSASASQAAEFTGHWTLDDLSIGIQNSGTNGATSNMTAVGGPSLTSGIIGGALFFDGSDDYLFNQTAGNAAAVLTSYPVSFSTWVNKNSLDTQNTHNIAVGFSQAASGTAVYGAGMKAPEGAGEVVTSNTQFDFLGSGLIDGLWHNIVGVVNSTTSVQVYVDGKLVGTDNSAAAFNTNVDTLTIGGAIRNTNQFITKFGGDIDDAGLYDSNLSAGEVALINGLGRIGGIGLDQFDEAQDLLGSVVGTKATIGGVKWERVDSLTGVTGDFGGSLSNFDGFIVTDDLGGGLLQVAPIPEPSSFLLLGLGMLGLARRRRRSGK